MRSRGNIPTLQLRRDSLTVVNWLKSAGKSPDNVMVVVGEKDGPIRWTGQKNPPNTSSENTTRSRIREQTRDGRDDGKLGDQIIMGGEEYQNDQEVLG